MAPNPFTIRYVPRGGEDRARPLTGDVSVLLVDVLGRPLDMSVQNELAGGARKALSIGSTSAVVSFSLKMHVTSRGEALRLAFDCVWKGADGIDRTERILSDPFRVNTNIRRQKKGKVAGASGKSSPVPNPGAAALADAAAEANSNDFGAFLTSQQQQQQPAAQHLNGNVAKFESPHNF